jgi:pimeloyl-ACP methyl ester carboxylesterase
MVALVTVTALLAGAVLYGAYGYLPAEAGRGYQPHYTQLHDRHFRWNLAGMTALFGASKSSVRGAVDDLLVHRERATRDGCGHAPQLDCPEQVNPLLTEFLRDGRGR